MGAGGGLQTGIQLGVALSARAILARLHLAPRKHEDWKVVQFQSGTKERNEFCRMEEGRLAGLIAASRIDGCGSVYIYPNACAIERRIKSRSSDH